MLVGFVSSQPPCSLKCARRSLRSFICAGALQSEDGEGRDYRRIEFKWSLLLYHVELRMEKSSGRCLVKQWCCFESFGSYPWIAVSGSVLAPTRPHVLRQMLSVDPIRPRYSSSFPQHLIVSSILCADSSIMH